MVFVELPFDVLVAFGDVAPVAEALPLDVELEDLPVTLLAIEELV